MENVRPAAVAGMFYPGDPKVLSAEIDELLGGVEELSPRLGFPKALIVPHAGYIYSGPVAARAYDDLVPARGIVRGVVLPGPVRRVAVGGPALPGAEFFDTPLGRIPVDQELVQALASLPQVVTSGSDASAWTSSWSTGMRPSGVSKNSAPGSAGPPTATRRTGPGSTTPLTIPRAGTRSS